MSKAIKRIRNYSKHFELSDRQTLYLIYKYHGINYDINAKNLIELINLGILDEEGNFVENLDTVTKLTSKSIIVVKPLFYNKMSAKVYSYLKKNICFKNPYDNLPLAINPLEIKLDTEAKISKYKKDSISKLKKETGFYQAYMLFLCLMPTSEKAHNSKWNKFFKVIYGGVNLRKRTTTNTNAFVRIIRKNDTGVFLYSLYLFIRSGIKGDNTYIGSQKTFLSEWEDWYMQAENLIDNAEKVETLFKHSVSKSSHKGGVAL